MAKRSKADLKKLFEKGDRPTQQDFIDLIDSMLSSSFEDWPDTLPAASAKLLTEVDSVAVFQPWATLTGTPGYLDADTVIQSGNVEASFFPGQRVRLTLAGGDVFTDVLSVSYDGANNRTIINLVGAVADNTVLAISPSLFLPVANGGAVGLGTLGGSALGTQLLSAPNAAAGRSVLGAVSISDVRYLGTASGVTTIALTPTPAIAAYAEGQLFSFKTAGESGANPTLNISGLGPLNLVDRNGVQLPARYLPGGTTVLVQHDGTSFRVMGGAQDYRMPPVIAYLTSSQSLGDGTLIEVGAGAATWTEVIDAGSNFDAATGRFTAPVAGIYEFQWQAALDIAAANGTERLVSAIANTTGATLFAVSTTTSGAFDGQLYTSGSAKISLSAGAVVSLWVIHFTGTSRSLLGGGIDTTSLSIFQVG